MPDLRTTTTPTLPPLVVSNAGVRSLLSRLDSNKAPGPDGIQARVLKQCANSISPALCRLFQASIDTGYLPHDWRSANITPIYKKDNRSDPSNYRPVSLTSIPSKILEHVIYRHLMTHLEANAILSDAQHGFRKGRSCETQLLFILENLTKTLDNRRQVDLIQTDFSKAFDKVPHQRLLLKFKNFAVQGPILDWLTCFVTKRTQPVALEEIKSEEVIVKSGVPQGTVLGPLLFLVFINDIHENVSSQLHLFADDCILYREVINIEDCNNLQRDISSICDWESEWQLEFNAVKCVALRMLHKKRILNVIYKMKDTPLDTVPKHKHLGVTITEKLDWSPHCNTIASKANRTLSVLRRHLKGCSKFVKSTTYKTLVDLNWSIAPPFGTHTTRRTKPHSKELKGEQLGL